MYYIVSNFGKINYGHNHLDFIKLYIIKYRSKFIFKKSPMGKMYDHVRDRKFASKFKTKQHAEQYLKEIIRQSPSNYKYLTIKSENDLIIQDIIE